MLFQHVLYCKRSVLSLCLGVGNMAELHPAVEIHGREDQPSARAKQNGPRQMVGLTFRFLFWNNQVNIQTSFSYKHEWNGKIFRNTSRSRCSLRTRWDASDDVLLTLVSLGLTLTFSFAGSRSFRRTCSCTRNSSRFFWTEPWGQIWLMPKTHWWSSGWPKCSLSQTLLRWSRKVRTEMKTTDMSWRHAAID